MGLTTTQMRVANISSILQLFSFWKRGIAHFFFEVDEEQVALLENTHESCSNEEALLAFKQMNFSCYQDATLGYIGEYIVRKIMKDISCDVCAGALAQSPNNLLIPDSLVTIKDNGGLFFCRWTCGK